MSSLIAEKEGELLLIDAIHLEAVVLEAEGALGKPVGLGHLFYKELFGGGGGLVFLGELVEERFEGGGIFACNDRLTRSEAVFECVAGRSSFPFSGGGTGRKFSVAAIDVRAMVGSGGRGLRNEARFGSGARFFAGAVLGVTLLKTNVLKSVLRIRLPNALSPCPVMLR